MHSISLDAVRKTDPAGVAAGELEGAQLTVAEAVALALSEKERAAFVLYEMEGVAGKQIASIVGCKEATLWRRLHDARKAIRAALERGDR